jgi:hypothetical protein
MIVVDSRGSTVDAFLTLLVCLHGEFLVLIYRTAKYAGSSAIGYHRRRVDCVQNMGYQNHRISWVFVKITMDEVRFCVVCSIPVEFGNWG